MPVEKTDSKASVSLMALGWPISRLRRQYNFGLLVHGHRTWWGLQWMPPKIPYLTIPTSCTGRGMFLHSADCVGNCKPCIMSSMCMLCGSQRKALQSKAKCSSSWTRMFFISCHISHCDWDKSYNITVDLPLRSTGLGITFAPPTSNLTWWPGIMLNVLCAS